MTNIRNLLLTVTLLGTSSAALCEQAAVDCEPEAFESARQVFHRTWFEQADEQFDAYFEVCEDIALAHAYAAVIDMLLYRDTSANTAAVDRLADTGTFAYALAKFANGKLPETEAALRRYLESNPGDPYAQHVLGFTLIDEGKNEAGIEVLESLLDSDPDFYPAMNHLAYGSMNVGDSASARRYAAAFVEADPGNPSPWDTQAGILNALGDREAAIASLSRSLMLDGRFAYGFHHMGKLLDEAGNHAAASAAFRQARSAAGQYGVPFRENLERILIERKMRNEDAE